MASMQIKGVISHDFYIREARQSMPKRPPTNAYQSFTHLRCSSLIIALMGHNQKIATAGHLEN
jgi:hypothetical protein